jgi:hypothetical protein
MFTIATIEAFFGGNRTAAKLEAAACADQPREDGDSTATAPGTGS